MKILYITTMARSSFGGFIRSSIVAAQQTGIEFHIASNEKGIDQGIKAEECAKLNIYHHHIDIARNPLAFLDNIRALNQVLNLIDIYNIDAIHCNTPSGGIIGRLAGKKTGVKVIYQAHGFHFWKGAPLKNWLFYFPVENYLSRYTDLLITIAKDDYVLAKKMKANKVAYVHGIGIDFLRYKKRADDDRNLDFRIKMGIPENATVLLSVGELNINKNHITVIRAIKRINRDNIYYVICGKGEKQLSLQTQIDRLGLHNRVFLVGFQSNVHEYYRMADLFVFPSLREGIPGAIMEAIAVGVPVIASDIRGVRDIVPDNNYRFHPKDADGLAKLIEKISGIDNSSNINKNYSNLLPYGFDNVVNELKGIYCDI